MSRRWVVSASPLIALANAEALSLLTALAAELAVPEGVVSEVSAAHAAEPSAGAMAQLAFA